MHIVIRHNDATLACERGTAGRGCRPFSMMKSNGAIILVSTVVECKYFCCTSSKAIGMTATTATAT